MKDPNEEFSTIDKDSTGKIELGEFCKWLL